ncbi:MAG: START domain-containing protein [Turneriella sp.]
MRRFLLLTLLTLPLAADDWKYAKSADGVTAYTRSVLTSSFKEYKVETEIEATLSQVVAVLMNVAELPQWVDRCAEAKILKEISATESIARTVTVSPFPLKNREAIAHGKLTQDPHTKIVTLTSTGRPDFTPPNVLFERVKELRGRWVLTPKPGGKVHIQMIGHTDPGGIIPAAIANQFVVMIPFNTIKNLRKQVKKEKYAKVKLKYIRE